MWSVLRGALWLMQTNQGPRRLYSGAWGHRTDTVLLFPSSMTASDMMHILADFRLSARSALHMLQSSEPTPRPEVASDTVPDMRGLHSVHCCILKIHALIDSSHIFHRTPRPHIRDTISE